MRNRLPILLLLFLLAPLVARAQSLATRRLIETAKTDQIPEIERAIAEKTGAKIPVEVDFASLGDEAATFDSLRVTFNRVVSALEEQARDKLGKEAVAAKVKRVAIARAKDLKEDAAELKDGTLSLRSQLTDSSTLTVGGVISAALEKGL